MVQTKFDTERVVGVQLRAISGDISREFREEVLEEIYKDKSGNITDVGKSCAKWHWAVCSYFGNPNEAEDFIMIIQHAFRKGINLDNDERWKFILRITLPTEFFNMMDKFTQIPQLAARNLAKPHEEEHSNPWG